MTTMVALLRGVNVGGDTTLRMADLRELVVECGFDRVRTYIQSGNVVFEGDERDPATVAHTLREVLAARTTVVPDVVVRTRDELAAVVEANPYVDRMGDPTQVHVVFLDGDADASLGGVTLDDFAPEHATAVGREVYLFLPDGIGRSRLATALNRGARRSSGTARNWRTVTTLLRLADEAP